MSGLPVFALRRAAVVAAPAADADPDALGGTALDEVPPRTAVRLVESVEGSDGMQGSWLA